MDGSSAPGAPQPAPATQNPPTGANASSSPASAQPAPPAASTPTGPASAPTSPTKATKEKKTKEKPKTAPPPTPVRATRSTSAIALDADQLRLEQFGSRQEKLEKRMNDLENNIACAKVNFSKSAPKVDDTRLRDVDNRTALLERNVHDLSLARAAAEKDATARAADMASLSARVACIPDLESRISSLEREVDTVNATMSAAMADIADMRAALKTVEDGAIEDWNTLVQFREDIVARLMSAEQSLQDIDERAAATAAALPRAPSPTRRAGRHGRDEDTGPDDPFHKRVRRDSDAGPRASLAPAPPTAPAPVPAPAPASVSAPAPPPADLPRIWLDGENGEDDWVSCRVGQPQRTANVAALTWTDNNERNLAVMATICENLASHTGSCPTPIKSFMRDGESNNIWRYFQFASRENLLRFMSFWRHRTSHYSSLRAIPISDVDNVASIADVMRSHNPPRAPQDRRRETNGFRRRT